MKKKIAPNEYSIEKSQDMEREEPRMPSSYDRRLQTPIRGVATQLLAFLALAVATMAQQEVLTNEVVVNMTKAHLSEKLIVEMIQTNPGKFVITPTALIALKQQGVSDSAISAMRVRMASKSEVPAASVPTGSRAETTKSGWDVRVVHDKMTGEPSVEASALMSIEQGAHARVTAKCGYDNEISGINSIPDVLSTFMQKGLGLPGDLGKVRPRGPSLDTRFLSFRLTYSARPGSGIAVRRSQLPQRVHTDSSGNGTIAPPRSCSILRVMVDGQGRNDVESEVCNLENTVAFSFVNFTAKDMAKAMGMGVPGTDTDTPGFGKWMNNLLDTTADMSDTTIAKMDEVFRAKEIRAELPLTNGDSALVTIQSQEPAFQKFAATCNSEFPDKTATERARLEKERKDKEEAAAIETQRRQTAASSAAAAALPPSALTVAASIDRPVQKASSPPGAGAVLMIMSGFPSRAGAPNLLARIPYKLMRDDFATTLNKGGIRVRAGATPKEALSVACMKTVGDCSKVIRASVANPVASVVSSASGSGAFPGVPPGTYYLMVYAYDERHRSILWNLKVDLKPGANSVTLGKDNETPFN